MGLLGALLAGWLLWLGVSGRIARPGKGQLVALLFALVGGALAAKGMPFVGGALAVGGLAWLSRRPGRQASSPAVGVDDRRTLEALDLLGLAPGAGRDDVIEAHRRLIARVHPDAGGTEALARNLNMARDHLLKRLPD